MCVCELVYSGFVPEISAKNGKQMLSTISYQEIRKHKTNESVIQVSQISFDIRRRLLMILHTIDRLKI